MPDSPLPPSEPTAAEPPVASATTPGSAVLVIGACWSAGIALGAQSGLAARSWAWARWRPLWQPCSPGPGRLVDGVGVPALLLAQLRLVLIHDARSPDVLAPLAGAVVVTGRVVDAPIPRGGRVEAVVEVDTVAALQSSDPPMTLGEPRPRVLVRAPTLRASYGDRDRRRAVGWRDRARGRAGRWPICWRAAASSGWSTARRPGAGAGRHEPASAAGRSARPLRSEHPRGLAGAAGLAGGRASCSGRGSGCRLT